MHKFILASKSPRRSEILQRAGFDFKIIPSEADETVDENMTSEQIAENLAVKKGLWVAQRYQNENIIAADTIVSIDNNILGKPEDEENAFEMLRMLSGREHIVYTGVYLKVNSKTISFTESTIVNFYNLSDEQIKSYIATGEPMDKAGAYGIQEKGSLLVKDIKGDFFNVMGLPIGKINQVIERIIKLK